MKSGIQILEWSRDDLVVTEFDIHVVAFACASRARYQEAFVAPSNFIRRSRILKWVDYRMARRLFLALGGRVPDVPVLGSGQPKHMLPALQLAWSRMREDGD